MTGRRMGSSGEIWVIAEQRQGKVAEVSLELLGKGGELSREMGMTLSSVLLGDGVERAADELVFHGAEKVYLLEDERLSYYHGDAYARLLTDIAREHRPEIILIGATEIGKELAPKVAARLGTGLTAHCIDLHIGEVDGVPQLVHMVPGWGGNLVMHIVCAHKRPQIITVRPGMLPKPERNEHKRGEIVRVEPRLRAEDFSRMETVEVVDEPRGGALLDSADVVVCGGWGMSALGDFSKAKDLADVLGGVVAGTRPAMDRGWVDENQMIGQSGRSVRPRLFVSLGASGAMHYTTGFTGSQVILAVDKNPQAPILQVADIGIVGDLSEVLPCLIEELRKDTLRRKP
jgi:electron transfer flavoprotein alpha subunit